MSELGAKIVVRGVTGVGKTTLGQFLADLLAVPYADGDSFHSDESIRKMSAKQPLNDHDREPWLNAIGPWLCRMETGGVVSCSALRRRYRDALVAQSPDCSLSTSWSIRRRSRHAWRYAGSTSCPKRSLPHSSQNWSR